MNKILGVTMFVVGLCCASCSDDDESISYSQKPIANSELKTILMQKGYQFSEDGKLLLDDLANNTTTLDLSGTNITDLSELDILPNLKEVDLSDNGYGPAFDFSQLPTQITGIDLRGNKIYDFEGLVDASVVNDEVQTTILHNLTKLYLPETAKWNVEDLMPFYTKNQADGTNVDMQMVDEDGNLQAYNTLREIPDEYFRAYLKTKFASLFPDDGTQIDISKPMGLTESGESINLWYANQFADIAKIKSIEGVEYFINNPYYKDFWVSIGCEQELFTVSYLAPRANIKSICLYSTNTPDGLDFSKATKLAALSFKGNESLTTLDLSNTLIGNQDISEYESSVSNQLYLNNCANLTNIVLPSEGVGVMSTFALINLPKLETIDLSGIKAIEFLSLLKLQNCKITYPTALQYRFRAAYKTLTPLSADDQILFAISEDVFGKDETKDFITNYRSYLMDYWMLYIADGGYMWSAQM